MRHSRKQSSFAVVILGLAFLSNQGVSECGVARFRPAVGYPTGTYPQGVVVGDFNEDGIPDLAIANRGDSSVSILLGVGDGSFQPPMTFTSGGAWGIAVGDFNGDGNLDIVTANGDANVSVLFGDGHGSFSAPSNFAVGGNAYGVAVGDLNGDQKLDIAAVNGLAGTASILLGDGTGGFAAHSNTTPSLGFLTSLAIADLNGDGKKDLIATTNGSVAIFLGHGDGTFAAPTSYSVQQYANYVAVGDLNGDGIPDLIVVSASGSIPGAATVFLGQGAGNFVLSHVYYPANDSMGDVTFPYSAVIGDFDMDGKPDFAMASFGTTGGFGHLAVVSVFQGDGAGNFASPIAFQLGAGEYTYSMAASDLNGDGAPDIVVTNMLTTDVLINSTRGPLLYYTVQPCRVADTRLGPDPPVQAGHTSFFTIAGKCGIPTSARAVSANVTVVGPTQAASLSLFPGDISSTGTNTISFQAGHTRANNGLLTLDGTCGVNAVLTLGSTDLVLDVSGYFQ